MMKQRLYQKLVQLLAPPGSESMACRHSKRGNLGDPIGDVQR